MAFIDKIKKALQQGQKEVQAPPTKAESFKQYVANKQASEPKIFNNATNWMMNSALNQRDRTVRQTATQNITGAERTIQTQPVARGKVGLTSNNIAPVKEQEFDEQNMRATFKQYNPNATDEELDNYINRLKAQNGQRVVATGKAVQKEETKEQLVRDKKTGELREKNAGDKLKEEATKPFENLYEKGLKPGVKNALEGVEGFVNDASAVASMPGLTLLQAPGKIMNTVSQNTKFVGRRYENVGDVLTLVGNITGNQDILRKGQEFKKKGQETQQVGEAVDTARDKTGIDTLQKASEETTYMSQEQIKSSGTKKFAQLLPSITTSSTMALLSLVNPALRNIIFFRSNI